MIRTLLQHPGGARDCGGVDLLDAWTPDGDSILWLDCEGEAAQVRELLGQRFGIHPLAISDALRDRHPPKIEWFDDCVFLLVKGFTAETSDIDFDLVHISFFIGRNFLLTVHARPSPSIDATWPEAVAGDPALQAGVAGVAYRVLRRVVDRYAPVVLGLENRLDELEEEITERPHDALLIELQRYILQLRKLRRMFAYQQSCFDALRQAQSPLLGAHARHQMQDLWEHMERMTSLSALLADLARDLRDGYISLSGHRLNTIMKTLTIASVIFLPLGFLAGVYGMNFENMPELRSEYGYPVLLGGMGLLVTALLWGFRRARWL